MGPESLRASLETRRKKLPSTSLAPLDQMMMTENIIKVYTQRFVQNVQASEMSPRC